jgi:endonuclease YncB( thermonuclease family)
MFRSPAKLPFSSPLRGRGPSPRTVAIIAAGVIAAGAVAMSIRPAQVHASLSGRPTIVDGDTLDFGNTRVRIVGIDAPELGQTCHDVTGVEWHCGRDARAALRVFAGTEVRCAGDRLDRYGRVLATCSGSGGDLGAEMVRSGMAVANGRYFDEQAEAQARNTGIWAGPFETPRAFRDRASSFDLWAWITSWFGD